MLEKKIALFNIDNTIYQQVIQRGWRIVLPDQIEEVVLGLL